MSSVKKFQVLLEGDEKSQATGFTVPFDVKETFGSRARLPVCGTINGFPYRSSIFPEGNGKHYMVVNKSVREGAKATAGDIIDVVMEVDKQQRVITAPPDLMEAMNDNKNAKSAWEKLSYTHKKEYVKAIEEAKKPETRERRIKKAIEELSERIAAKNTKI